MTLKARITAIDRFIKGLREDGIYNDLQAACVMAGWSNLAGALTPLVGAAPTNSGFIATDYDRGIGITGDGTSYLDSNRANNADPQSSKHLSVYVSKAATYDSVYSGAGGNNNTAVRRVSPTTTFGSVNRSTGHLTYIAAGESIGTLGVNRPSASATELRIGGVTVSDALPPTTYPADNIGVFSRIASSTAAFVTDATLSFYSIGTSLDLALLDARVSTLMADLRAIEETGFDRDAIAYIRAVEEADGAYLETDVKVAINNLVAGLKAEGLWDAMASSCLLCGPRTLAGALVPLRGDAPTAYGFVEGDYDREGLAGDGTSYLDSNRLDTADPTNDRHIATYVTAAGTLGTRAYIESYDYDGAVATTITGLRETDSNNVAFVSCLQFNPISPQKQTGFFGASRNNASDFAYRYNGAGGINTVDSIAVVNQSTYSVFASTRYDLLTPWLITNAKLAFYSIGSSVDLSKLDSHISSYVTAIGAAV